MPRAGSLNDGCAGDPEEPAVVEDVDGRGDTEDELDGDGAGDGTDEAADGDEEPDAEGVAVCADEVAAPVVMSRAGRCLRLFSRLAHDHGDVLLVVIANAYVPPRETASETSARAQPRAATGPVVATGGAPRFGLCALAHVTARSRQSFETGRSAAPLALPVIAQHRKIAWVTTCPAGTDTAKRKYP